MFNPDPDMRHDELDYIQMFDSIAEQALQRYFTSREAFELARTFAACVTAQCRWFFEAIDEKSIIPQPLSYTIAIGLSHAARKTHHTITLLVVRTAEAELKTAEPQWARWIALMLWIGSPKEDSYLGDLTRRKNIEDDEETRHMWDKVEGTFTRVPIENPHIEEITRLLWPEGDEAMKALSMDAFRYPERLVCDIHSG